MAINEWILWGTALVGGGFGGALIQGAFDRSKVKLTGTQNRELQADKLHHEQDRQELELSGQEARLAREHGHQRDMLAQSAHFEVRKDMANLAGNVYAWLTHELLDKHGAEADLFAANVPKPPYLEPSRAIGDLRQISATHPTAKVRALAADLADDLLASYNKIAASHNEMYEPTSDDFVDWRNSVATLIEVINEPPSRTATIKLAEPEQ